MERDAGLVAPSTWFDDKTSRRSDRFHSRVVGVVLVVGVLVAGFAARPVSSFSTSSSSISARSRRSFVAVVESTTTRLSANDDDEKEVWINPFEQSRGAATSTRRVAPNVTDLNLRRMRMDDLVSSLSRCVNNDESMRRELSANEDLLMAPFEDDYDPRLDKDSIYTVDMDRQQKLSTFTTVMEDRVARAKSETAKIILNAMTNFVLECSEREGARSA